MLISLGVRLVIPDTTASTARRALQNLGLNALIQLRREICWEFALTGNVRIPDLPELAERLVRTDVLVNQNKHRARWWTGDLTAGAVGAEAAPAGRLLVEDREDTEIPRMQALLVHRLAFADLAVRRHATLWIVSVAAGADPATVARSAMALLLVNPHGQVGTLLGGRVVA